MQIKLWYLQMKNTPDFFLIDCGISIPYVYPTKTPKSFNLWTDDRIQRELKHKICKKCKKFHQADEFINSFESQTKDDPSIYSINLGEIIEMKWIEEELPFPRMRQTR